MHIKQLVLEDFKSFKGTTRIPLYDDFTTISGPNGSGKSNIIDGVLFALGLARTRGIRARKLTDLIHNPGHDDETLEDMGGRGGPSEASVTVVLDNADRAVDRGDVAAAMGVEAEAVEGVDEITVKRRVKETEANYYSYYYLNERSVNLSDVRELLSAAGVTPEGYNVVMQGDVTDITSMTATERRRIIDEIAGVAQFDEKKRTPSTNSRRSRSASRRPTCASRSARPGSTVCRTNARPHCSIVNSRNRRRSTRATARPPNSRTSARTRLRRGRRRAAS
jgi:condensin subunit Smc